MSAKLVLTALAASKFLLQWRISLKGKDKENHKENHVCKEGAKSC